MSNITGYVLIIEVYSGSFSGMITANFDAYDVIW